MPWRWSRPRTAAPLALTSGYNQYRQALGLAPGTLQYASGATLGGSASSELTLDISVVAGAVPNSTIRMYSDLGGTPYNAYQQIFFDANRPGVLSSSFPIVGQSTANSPFQWAFQQLMKDGVLANVTVHMAGGDEGASAAIANGNVNVTSGHSSPYTILVGGTSIATLSAALTDPTLTTPTSPAVQSMVQLALQNDPGDRLHHGRRRPEDAAQPSFGGNTGARGSGQPARPRCSRRCGRSSPSRRAWRTTRRRRRAR